MMDTVHHNANNVHWTVSIGHQHTNYEIPLCKLYYYDIQFNDINL